MDMHRNACFLLVILYRQVESIFMGFALIKVLIFRFHRFRIQLPFQQCYKVVIGFLPHDVCDCEMPLDLRVEALVH